MTGIGCCCPAARPDCVLLGHLSVFSIAANQQLCPLNNLSILGLGRLDLADSFLSLY